MNKERISVKALCIKLDDSKKDGSNKRWREVVEPDINAKGLQKLDAKDHTQWRLSCKNQLISASRKTCQVSGGEKRCNLTLRQSDDDASNAMHFVLIMPPPDSGSISF